MLDAEQIHDLQMLDGLRHDAFIGGDDEQHHVDTRRARQHIMHEPLMAGHVDKAEHRTVRHRRIGIAEVDGDAALLLLGQPVGIDARQCLDQRGLAVIDVAGGADDHGASPAMDARWAASSRS